MVQTLTKHLYFIHYFPYRLPCYFPIDNNIFTLVFAEAVDRELRASGYTYMRIDGAISCFFTFVAVSWKIQVSDSFLETFKFLALSWNLSGSRLFKNLKIFKMIDVFFGVQKVPKGILKNDWRVAEWCTEQEQQSGSCVSKFPWRQTSSLWQTFWDTKWPRRVRAVDGQNMATKFKSTSWKPERHLS